MERPRRPPPRVGDGMSGMSATITDPGGVDMVEFSPALSTEPRIFHRLADEHFSHSNRTSRARRANTSASVSPMVSPVSERFERQPRRHGAPRRKPAPSEPGRSRPAPSEPEPSEPALSEPAPSEPAPSEPARSASARSASARSIRARVERARAERTRSERALFDGAPVEAPQPEPPPPVPDLGDDGDEADISNLGPAQWRTHFLSPSFMALFMCLGIAFGLGHHAYYQSFDGAEVVGDYDQVVTGVGIAFAVLTKTTLCAAIGMAFTQQLWVTARRRFLTLGSIDGMFSLLSNPTAFLNLELLFDAKRLFLVGAIAWVIPTIVMVAPASMSVESTENNELSFSDVPVPRLAYGFNFSDWNSIRGGAEDAGIEALLEGSPSPLLSRLITETASSVGVVPMTAPFPNSSFSLTFHGPSYKCDPLETALREGNDSVSIQDSPYDSLEDAWNQTVGQFVNPSYLYVGGAPDAPTLSHLFFNFDGPKGMNISCQQWNTSYAVLFNYASGVQTTTVEQAMILAPSNYSLIGNQDIPAEANEELFAYQRLHKATQTLFGGAITTAQSGDVHPVSPHYLANGSAALSIPLLHTGLVACPELRNPTSDAVDPFLCRNDSFARAVEDLSHNITLSLFSAPSLAPLTGRGPREGISVAVARSFSRLRFRYHRGTLLAPYVAAFVLTAMCLGIGANGYRANGYSASRSFSSIVFTTRNMELDDMAHGRCLGAWPLRGEPSDVRLRFGMTHVPGMETHAAFGTPDTIRRLKNKEECW